MCSGGGGLKILYCIQTLVTNNIFPFCLKLNLWNVVQLQIIGLLDTQTKLKKCTRRLGLDGYVRVCVYMLVLLNTQSNRVTWPFRIKTLLRKRPGSKSSFAVWWSFHISWESATLYEQSNSFCMNTTNEVCNRAGYPNGYVEWCVFPVWIALCLGEECRKMQEFATLKTGRICDFKNVNNLRLCSGFVRSSRKKHDICFSFAHSWWVRF